MHKGSPKGRVCESLKEQNTVDAILKEQGCIHDGISRVRVGRESNSKSIAFRCVFALRDGPTNRPTNRRTDRQSDL